MARNTAKNVIYELYEFRCCKKEDGESFDNFVTRIREKVATSEYRQLLNKMIFCKIVLGMKAHGADC